MTQFRFIQWGMHLMTVCCLILVTTATPAQTSTLPVVEGQQALQAAAIGSEEKLVAVENVRNIHGFSITADVELYDPSSVAKVILVDNQQREYLVYEGYPAIADNSHFLIQQACEETCLFTQPVETFTLRLEVQNAAIYLREIAYTVNAPNVSNLRAKRDSLKREQDLLKIQKLNAQNLGWVAGETSISQLSYEEKKHLFLNGKVPNLQGFEYYTGGIFEVKSGDVSQNTRRDTRAGSRFPVVSSFSWLDRHGKNWVTSVKNQGSCGSCWAFATVGVLESLMKTYYNAPSLDLDLSEQELVSCSGAGVRDKNGREIPCNGGYVDKALDYIKLNSNNSLVDEQCFSYSATEASCSNKCSSSNDNIRTINRSWVAGSNTIASNDMEKENYIKRLIIEKGSLITNVISLWHYMTLVGFDTDSSDGKTIWIFKNSWGAAWGANPLRGGQQYNWGIYEQQGYANAGYAYVKLEMSNTHFDIVELPITDARKNYSINCVDGDGDNLCNWGISRDKPSTCPSSCKAQKDCDDSNSNLGSFATDYSCRPISEMSKTQQVTVRNTGEAQLNVSAISANVNWVTAEPSQFQLEPNASKVVDIKVDYGQVPVGQNQVTLTVNSDDPATPSAPVKISVQQAEELTPRVGAAAAKGASYNITSDTIKTAGILSSFMGRVSLPTKATTDTFTVSASNSVSISGQIFVDPAHVGKTADIAVLVILQGQSYFLTPKGLVDGNPAQMQFFMSGVTLEEIQHVSMYSGQLPANQQITVLFGYKLSGSSEIIYSSSSPMNIFVTQ